MLQSNLSERRQYLGKKTYLICLVSVLLLISIYGCTYTVEFDISSYVFKEADMEAAKQYSSIYGCTDTTSFNILPYVDMEAAKQYSSMQSTKTAEQILFLKEYPKESHVVLGTLHASEIYECTAQYDMDDLIKAMRKKVVEIGADAIVDFRLKENPTVQSVGGVSISGSRADASFSAVPYKGLQAWGEAIIFIPEDKKERIESK